MNHDGYFAILSHRTSTSTTILFFILFCCGFSIFVPTDLLGALHIDKKWIQDVVVSWHSWTGTSGLNLPLHSSLLSSFFPARDMTKVEPAPDFLLIGASGFIGSHIKQALLDAHYEVDVCPGIRLEQVETLRTYIDGRRPRYGVIVAAGTRGSPNVDWCLSHPAETIETNVLGQLNVARICRELGNLHCTFIGSGLVYGSLDEARFQRGEYFDEETDRVQAVDYIDGQNAGEKSFSVLIGDQTREEKVHVYRKMRCLLEELLSYYPNILNLRVLFPISMADRAFTDRRSLLAKLRNFTKIDNSQVSVTFLDNLAPSVAVLIKKGATGNLNFVNHGALSYADVVSRFKKLYAQSSYDPELSDGTGRGNILMKNERLLSIVNNEVPILSTTECLDAIFNVET